MYADNGLRRCSVGHRYQRTTICAPEHTCYGCKSDNDPFFGRGIYGVWRLGLLPLVEREANIIDFIVLHHSSAARKSVRKKQGNTAQFKYKSKSSVGRKSLGIGICALRFPLCMARRLQKGMHAWRILHGESCQALAFHAILVLVLTGHYTSRILLTK